MTVTIPPPPGEQHRRSPFTPTFGSTPPALVGRQQEVNDFAYALDNGAGSKGRATFVTGAGKPLIEKNQAPVKPTPVEQ